ncbi:MAG: uracil-DNA glycosylase, partial [Actinomycetota bacterium]|nr:uracil-DNA glycosylase [Actinomycetota bacterium]
CRVPHRRPAKRQDHPVAAGSASPSERFVRALAAARIGATFNFYRDGTGAALRRERLVEYLERRRSARFVLVGEAPGYRGARISGIPFTSERQLSGSGPAEATATIVQRALWELGIASDVLLWNVVPTHPHRAGEPASNRVPAAPEIRAGLRFLDELLVGRAAVAVGRVAHGVLGGPYVRHPSHGGSAAFRDGLLLSIRRCGTSSSAARR